MVQRSARCSSSGSFKRPWSTPASPTFVVEEYHGNQQQVMFQTSSKVREPMGVCELCDLMIIVFSNNPPSVRLTFLQAKYERRALVHHTARTGLIVQLKANPVQWDLLAARPLIDARYPSKFDPPRELLGGDFPSLGSFGFFHRLPSGLHGMFYCAASLLVPPRPKIWTDVSFSAPACGVSRYYGPSLRSESLSEPDIQRFGNALAGFEIENPLEFDSTTTNAPWRMKIGNWLRATLPTLQPQGQAKGLATILQTVLTKLLSASTQVVRGDAPQLPRSPDSRDDSPPPLPPPEGEPPGAAPFGVPATVLIYARNGARPRE
jgi:hypothetical protein